LKKIVVLLIIALSFFMSACSSPADVASQNASKEADQFHVLRRIVFVNGITDKYLATIEGYCSLGNFDPQKELSVTCKVGDNAYKKWYLGLSDNVTYLVEQLDPINVSSNHYEVIFQPTTIVPDVVIP
jgi:ABC-type Fe3+-hydroxamate transport system substrate-binding protein